MSLLKITDRIIYMPHQPEVDRPMLVYIEGEKYSLAIDAGYSASHVEKFYVLLEAYFNGGYLDKEKLGALIQVIEKTDCRYCILSHDEPSTKEELLEYLYGEMQKE